MPLGIKAWTVQALIDFMYKGHINVSQCGLRELVRSAESLQISGLDNARKDLSKYYQRVDASYKDVEEANEHKKLRRWKNEQFEQRRRRSSTEATPHDVEQGDDGCKESEYFLQQQQQLQSDDGNVVHIDNNVGNDDATDDDDDDGNNEIFENITAAVDDADDEGHVFPPHNLSDVSYCFEIGTKNYVATKKRRTSEQTKNTTRGGFCDSENTTTTTHCTKMDFNDRQGK